MGFILAMLVGTVVAVAMGWFVGGQFAAEPEVEEVQAAKVEIKKKSKGKKKDKADSPEAGDESEIKAGPGDVVTLDPILVVLRDSDRTFLRLELALVVEEQTGSIDQETRIRLMSDLSNYSKTITLHQLSGPSGYLHFRDDLLDRARLTTNGGIRDVLILSMVAE